MSTHIYVFEQKKENPCKPQFYYIKWSLRGSKLYRRVFVMTKVKLLPMGTFFFPFSVNPFSERRQTQFDRVSAPNLYSFSFISTSFNYML